VEETISVDRQGRIVIPAHIRKALSIKEGGKLLIRVEGSKMVLELLHENLRESVEKWVNLAQSTKAKINTEEPEESWKWISRDYAKRKLGIP